ncbi:MAG: type II toxin-antitoxin system death-on-curing family toxin [Thermodesulfobacteriota bacterium]
MTAEVNLENVVFIHEFLVDYFQATEDPISPAGVKDVNLLASAVARPFQSVGGEEAYGDVFAKAAALFHSLIHNHPFHNGNKRTALIAAGVYLDDNGFWLDGCSDEELFEFTRKVAAHEITEEKRLELDYIAEWFRANSRKRMKNEKPLSYHELKDRLHEFGYEIDPPRGELLNIYKNREYVTRIIKQGTQGFRPYHTHYIAELRKRLSLTPEFGVDSDKFYGKKGLKDSVSEMIEIRNEVIRRLAKI